MVQVYVIKNCKDKYYVGVTDDLRRRLFEHRSGYSTTTRRMGHCGTFELIHNWTVPGWEEGFKLETYTQRAARKITDLLDLILDVPLYNKFLAEECKSIKTISNMAFLSTFKKDVS